MSRIFWAYEQHAAEWDAEFRSVRGRFADRMQCRRGCTMCCSQMFSISALEAAVIAARIAATPERERDRLRKSAREYLDTAARRGLLREGGGEESIAPRPGERLACPALQADACSIYEARPLICRKWGIPVYDPSKPDRLHACALNFTDGEPVDARDLIASQAALLERWASLRDDARAQLAGFRGTSTVAEAILAAPAADAPHDPSPRRSPAP